uniref:DUF4794 domain-containing protein n=1 Tax=Photinus pyralis TaxID=7054 RepID=A0A1Y1MJS7_PHOPY
MFSSLTAVACLCVAYSVSSPLPQHPVVIAHHGLPYFYHTGIVPVVHDASKLTLKATEDAPKADLKAEKQEEITESTTPEAPAEPAVPTEAQSDDGSYKEDKTGDYVPDNAGDYVHDNSGDYKPESELGELKLHRGTVVFAGNPFIPSPLYPFPYYF